MDEHPWQVSDGPFGNRSMSYDFKTKAEAEVWLKEQGSQHGKHLQTDHG